MEINYNNDEDNNYDPVVAAVIPSCFEKMN